MPSLLVAHRRPGFYLRVLEEGEFEAGDTIERVERGPEAMTVAEIDGLLYLPNRTRRDLTRAPRIPALSEGWRGSFRQLLEQAPDGEGAALAWEGPRPLRVVAIDRESSISSPAASWSDAMWPAITGAWSSRGTCSLTGRKRPRARRPGVATPSEWK